MGFASAERLQQGMRHPFGKPVGLVARVNNGQILLSIRTKPQHKEAAMEAIRRSKSKMPGKQKIVVSCMWGFTSMTRADYKAAYDACQITGDSAYLKPVLAHKGPLNDHFKAIESLLCQQRK
ncbi:ribosomal protein L10e/L16 [Dichotomocladium elegans]|nr:ribosomal protein L10e/L16 [Dichotomocladium elegans]